MNEKTILNKIKRICAAIEVIAIILVILAYAKHMTNLGVFCCGVILTAGIIEATANPIEADEEEEE